MTISPYEYVKQSRRCSSVALIAIPTVVCAGMWVFLYVGLPRATSVRDFVGGDLGTLAGMAVMIPLIAFPFLLLFPILTWINNRFGIRCPSCNDWLSGRCDSEQVMTTRKCCRCDAIVLSDEKYTPTRPKENLWRVIPLSLILVACIVMLFIQDGRQLLNDVDWFQTSLFILIAWALGWRRSVMRRRWKQEAAGDESPGDS